MKINSVKIGVATKNGACFLTSDEERSHWDASTPFLVGESVNRIIMDREGELFAATLTEGVFKSADGGKSWNPSSRGLNVRKVWTLENDPHEAGTIYAGTQYGHLFRTTDSGNSWEEVVGLHKAPQRDKWGVDWGYGTTGLTIHTVKLDPAKKGRIYIIASGTGAYRSDDAGETWDLIKNGINGACPIGADENPYSRPGSTPDERLEEHLDQVHSCFHKLALSSNPGTIFQQNHCGVYLSRDYGNLWKDISPDRKTRFGFPVDIVENRNSNAFVIPVPLNEEICKEHNVCIRGQLSVYRTGDFGETWEKLEKGLPSGVHTNVLRDAFSHGSLASPGVYFGTTTGEVYGSTDLGETWNLLAKGLGRIQGITAFVA